MSKKAVEEEPMEPLVLVTLGGYYPFLLPVAKAVEFLQIAGVMKPVEREYLGPGKLGADADGYRITKIRPAKVEFILADMDQVCAQLMIQRLGASDKVKE